MPESTRSSFIRKIMITLELKVLDLSRQSCCPSVRGLGVTITNRNLIQQSYRYGKDKVEDGEKQFREALESQIHELIGQNPRIAVADSGYAIYYS